jgi:hypothetical protein
MQMKMENLMKNKITLPTWFPLKEYEIKLTPEIALQLIHKRLILKKELMANPDNVNKYEELFTSIIIESNVPDLISALPNTIPKAMQPLSITEAYMIVAKLVNNPQFRNRSDIAIFEDAIMKASRGETLSDEQKAVLQSYRETPWYNFQDEKSNTWLPDLPCNNGIPVTINPIISRKDALFEVKRLYNTHQKPKTRNLSSEIYSEWENKKIFSIYDLQAWFKIKNIKFTKMNLIEVLWDNELPVSRKISDSSVEPKTFINEAIKITNKAIDESTLGALFYTCTKRKILGNTTK